MRKPPDCPRVTQGQSASSHKSASFDAFSVAYFLSDVRLGINIIEDEIPKPLARTYCPPGSSASVAGMAAVSTTPASGIRLVTRRLGASRLPPAYSVMRS